MTIRGIFEKGVMETMDREVRKAWVERLRSGRVVQATGHLGYDDGSRCCLGVLCDLAVEAGVIPAPHAPRASILDYGDGDDSSDIGLPLAVAEWAGLNSEPRLVAYEGQPRVALTDINDGTDEIVAQPFPVIADLIEAAL
jgi:hypothetical protein